MLFQRKKTQLNKTDKSTKEHHYQWKLSCIHCLLLVNLYLFN